MSETAIEQVGELLKDRFTAYVILATDGEDLYSLFSNKTSAYGLMAHGMKKIEDSWEDDNEEEKVEEVSW